MARLPQATFALLLALLPATATLIGVLVLAQLPGPAELAGIGLVISDARSLLLSIKTARALSA
jgi:inner membrane transporter RhtA